MANQFEDNATNALVLILKGRNKTKAKFIFDFLISKSDMREKVSFEDLSDVRTREKFYFNKKKYTVPDILLKFKNNLQEYKVEVKDKNSGLTDGEKNKKNRDVFLIPKGYRHEREIPIENIIYWEKLFKEIDLEFGGECFDELNLTRDSLGIRSIASFDSYLAKALEVFCYLSAKEDFIKFKKLSQLWKDTDKYQGFWIECEDNYIFSFEKEDILIEYEYKKGGKSEEEIKKNFKYGHGKKYDFYHEKNKIDTFFCKILCRVAFMSEDTSDLVNLFFDEFSKFKHSLDEIK